MGKEALPEVELYSIGPKEVTYAAALLTREAVRQIEEGSALGMALVEEGEIRAAICAQLLPENETHMDIISLYVVPQYRRRGLGGTLLVELLEAFLAATDGSMERVVAVYHPMMEGLRELFLKAGFVTEKAENLVSWQVPLKELKGTKLFQKHASLPAGYYLYTVDKSQELDLRRLLETLRQNEVADLTMSQMRQAIVTASYILLNDRREPIACAFVSQQDERHVCLTQFFTANGSSKAGIIVLQAAAAALCEQLPDNVILEIPTITDSAARLVERLIPSARKECAQRAVLNLAEMSKD